jgi:hypothetical protein
MKNLKIKSKHTNKIQFIGTEEAVVAYLINLHWIQPHVEIHYPGGLVLQPKHYREVRRAS